MIEADAEFVEWLRGQIDIWEKSDAGSPECAQAYLEISAKGLSTARLLLAQSAEIARLKGCLTNIKEIYEIRADIFTNDADLAGSLYDRACAALEQ